MHRNSGIRRIPLVLSPALAIALTLNVAEPVFAQTADRYAVLVPAFKPTSEGVRENFGRDVAKELNKLLDQFATHRSVESKVLKDALKKFGIKEETLGDRVGQTECLYARQLAIQIDAQLVLCGEYTSAGSAYAVDAQVIAPASSDVFEMQAFQSSDPKETAQRLADGFQNFVEGLRVAVFCQQYIESENWASAMENCRNALAINPRNKGAAYNLASALWKSGDTQAAREMFTKVLEIDPVFEDALLSLGVLNAQAGQTDDAMKYFREYLNLNPGDVLVRITIATDAAQAGGNDAALQIIEDGMANATGDDLLKLQEYAGAFAMNGALAKMQASGDMANIGDARPLVERGLGYLESAYQAKGEETDVTVLRNMLTAYRLLDRTDQALAFGAEAVAHYPDDAPLWSTYADALSKAEKLRESLAALDRLEQIDPGYSPLYARRASWLIDADDLAGATRAITTGVEKGEIADDNADILAQKIAVTGFRKAQAGQHNAAAPYYDAASQVVKTASTRGMIAFFRGYSTYQVAVEREKPETLETARATLPMFQRVIELMQQAAAYTQSQPNLEGNRTQIIGAARQYIEIQELIIKRGR